MSSSLKIAIGQHSDKGRKEINQDFHGAYIPTDPLLSSKGIAVAIADGISSSDVSQIASETAVSGFLSDYYCTSESWSVKTAAQRVLFATNSWLYSQTRTSQFRFNKDKGYVCTFSTLVLKSTTAHIFHAGDSRIYRLAGNSLEQLTEDHRLWVSQEKSYLSRALGINEKLEIDYKTLPLEVGDVFILATDGVYEYAAEVFILKAIHQYANDLDKAARMIVDEALQQGSSDNLTVQIVRIEALPHQDAGERHQQLTVLPFPPELKARMQFDGYDIIRDVYISSRSHVYLAMDHETKKKVIIKTPSIEHQDDTQYLERFLMEEWIARRINNAHVLKACEQTRKRHFLYTVTEFIEGKTIAQWMLDNPKPDIETVRGIVEQIAAGLRAFHRQEMLHQDLRPNNIMIDQTGTVKIIDFGSTYVAGIMETTDPLEQQHILGTAAFTAPEYFLGESGTPRSDLFSLGVISYQLLSGKLPFGTEVVKARSKAAQRKLNYRSVLGDDSEIPLWVDEAIKKAVQPDPSKRYDKLSEFIYDLRNPNSAFLNKSRPPLLERNPLLVWKAVSLVLSLTVIYLLTR
ncbi:MAG TPA: protein kinase [Gammaproteobacteria bacterium]|nr:protein kinase [Gammaproteobacteria bacterium]